MNETVETLELRAINEYVDLLDMGGSAADRIRRVVDEELTERQRQMVEMYYIRQMTMPEIAGELGICPSSVSRTIMRGKRRIQKYIRYNGRYNGRTTVQS
ncbi:MAG: sigma-70 family RNA polymerase sigma factor [Oscillospiraceae bacterium]|jgi:RNA polymerase sigma factor (sigma-70 family)|nr:sigma-70 family RNA polymerase sigma factor [Oscillospiraceae bacterium]